jgi:D-glycero-alpha-D-manno-heptose-7-phosphate kinase
VSDLNNLEPADRDLSVAPRVLEGRALVVEASAPTRTADIGGWTDTWFAGEGLVCNIALDHRAEVRVALRPAAQRSVRLRIRMTDEVLEFEADDPPGRHPIIEHAVLAARVPGLLEVDIADSVLAGSGLGTSASVMVALVAALSAAAGESLSTEALVSRAHRYETITGKQSGVQDHAAAAWGGISRLEVRYPEVRRHEVVVPAAAFAGLRSRLHTVFLGTPHASSELHDDVIARLDAGHGGRELDLMRAAAARAAASLGAGDLDAFGASLTAAHEAIAEMHGRLVGDDANELVELARVHGAAGWKVNGAGGDGGSIVVLGPDDVERNAALVEACAARRGWHVLDADIGAVGVVTRIRSAAADLPG